MSNRHDAETLKSKSVRRYDDDDDDESVSTSRRSTSTHF
jgi:hypothetical protein